MCSYSHTCICLLHFAIQSGPGQSDKEISEDIRKCVAHCPIAAIAQCFPWLPLDLGNRTKAALSWRLDDTVSDPWGHLRFEQHSSLARETPATTTADRKAADQLVSRGRQDLNTTGIYRDCTRQVRERRKSLAGEQDGTRWNKYQTGL